MFVFVFVFAIAIRISFCRELEVIQSLSLSAQRLVVVSLLSFNSMTRVDSFAPVIEIKVLQTRERARIRNVTLAAVTLSATTGLVASMVAVWAAHRGLS